jgi:hypothetical protein
MRWSRVIGCGLLAATHHTGRVKFRIAKCECKFAKARPLPYARSSELIRGKPHQPAQLNGAHMIL